MHQFGDSQVLSQQKYEAQIRARVLEGSFVPGAPAHKLHFRGRLEVLGLTSLPEQDFSFHSTKNGSYIENHPKDHWPGIRIDFKDGSFGNGSLQVASIDNTVEAGVLVTRLLYALFSTEKCYLQETDGTRILELRFNKLPSQDLLFKAKLFRKLNFIETVFRTKFLLPIIYSGRDVERIEIVFRGITEGEFTTRVNDITFPNYRPSNDELNSSLFMTGSGSFSHTFTDHDLAIFDRNPSVGSITIQLDRAGLINPRALDQIRSGERQSIDLQLIVFDKQITYRFEKYAARSQRERKRKLEQFKSKLMHDEPAALADLLIEPLIPDVSTDVARGIVSGWLQYYDFPDRYCPQEPELEESHWRVPIWVTYPRGQGGWVQDAFVDVKTGVITIPVSVEELRNLGKSVAMEILSVS